MKTKLTELCVSRIRPPKSGRLEVWDSTLPAFGAAHHADRRRSYVVAMRKPGAKHPSAHQGGRARQHGARRCQGQGARVDGRSGRPGSRRSRRQPTPWPRVVAQFIERYQKPRNRHGAKSSSILTRELAPWADRPIQSITRRDVIELLDRDRRPGARHARTGCSRIIRKLFGWAMERDIVEASPVAGIKAPARETSRDRVLDA